MTTRTISISLENRDADVFNTKLKSITTVEAAELAAQQKFLGFFDKQLQNELFSKLDKLNAANAKQKVGLFGNKSIPVDTSNPDKADTFTFEI